MGEEGWEGVVVHDAFEIASEQAEEGTQESEGLKEAEDSNTTTATTNGERTTTKVGSLKTMSLGYILPSRSSAVIWRGPKKTAMIRQFLSDVSWGPTDYLLIDTPPGTSDEHIALAEQLHTLTSIGSNATSGDERPRLLGAVVVTTPQAVSVSDVRKELNFCTKTGIPVVGVIENMAGFMCPCCGVVSNVFSMGGGEVMAQEAGVRFLGRLPVDVGWGEIVEGKREDESGDREEKGMEGRLVERFRRGRLSGVFEGFVQDIVKEAIG
jgi:Mrp family chromosome partitioning ATPase